MSSSVTWCQIETKNFRDYGRWTDFNVKLAFNLPLITTMETSFFLDAMSMRTGRCLGEKDAQNYFILFSAGRNKKQFRKQKLIKPPRP
jgi:hypothetical protein